MADPLVRFTGNLKAPVRDYAVVEHPNPEVGQVGGDCIEQHDDGTATVAWGWDSNRVRGTMIRFVPKGD